LNHTLNTTLGSIWIQQIETNLSGLVWRTYEDQCFQMVFHPYLFAI
jgi:hypothetical protein